MPGIMGPTNNVDDMSGNKRDRDDDPSSVTWTSNHGGFISNASHQEADKVGNNSPPPAVINNLADTEIPPMETSDQPHRDGGRLKLPGEEEEQHQEEGPAKKRNKPGLLETPPPGTMAGLATHSLVGEEEADDEFQDAVMEQPPSTTPPYHQQGAPASTSGDRNAADSPSPLTVTTADKGGKNAPLPPPSVNNLANTQQALPSLWWANEQPPPDRREDGGAVLAGDGQQHEPPSKEGLDELTEKISRIDAAALNGASLHASTERKLQVPGTLHSGTAAATTSPRPADSQLEEDEEAQSTESQEVLDDPPSSTNHKEADTKAGMNAGLLGAPHPCPSPFTTSTTSNHFPAAVTLSPTTPTAPVVFNKKVSDEEQEVVVVDPSDPTTGLPASLPSHPRQSDLSDEALAKFSEPAPTPPEDQEKMVRGGGEEEDDDHASSLVEEKKEERKEDHDDHTPPRKEGDLNEALTNVSEPPAPSAEGQKMVRENHTSSLEETTEEKEEEDHNDFPRRKEGDEAYSEASSIKVLPTLNPPPSASKSKNCNQVSASSPASKPDHQEDKKRDMGSVEGNTTSTKGQPPADASAAAQHGTVATKSTGKGSQQEFLHSLEFDHSGTNSATESPGVEEPPSGSKAPTSSSSPSSDNSKLPPGEAFSYVLKSDQAADPSSTSSPTTSPPQQTDRGPAPLAEDKKIKEDYLCCANTVVLKQEKKGGSKEDQDIPRKKEGDGAELSEAALINVQATPNPPPSASKSIEKGNQDCSASSPASPSPAIASATSQHELVTKSAGTKDLQIISSTESNNDDHPSAHEFDDCKSTTRDEGTGEGKPGGVFTVLQDAASLISLGGMAERSSSAADKSDSGVPAEPPRNGMGAVAGPTNIDIAPRRERAAVVRGVKTGPTNTDVLCSRGRGYSQHPGNQRMLAIVKVNKQRYHQAANNKSKKGEIVKEVTHKIESGGSRFLKPFLHQSELGETTTWFELAARDKFKKVSHCLREDSTNESGDSSSESPSVPVASPKTELPKKRKAAKLPSSRLKASSNGNENKLFAGAKLPLKNAGSKRKTHVRTDTERDVDNEDSSSGSELDLGMSAASMKAKKKKHARRTYPAVSASRDYNERHSSLISGGRSEMLESNPSRATVEYQHPGPGMSGHGRLMNDASLASSQARAFNSSVIDKYGIVLGDPTGADVLFGQDPGFYTHLGNMQLRRMVQGSVGYPPISTESKIMLAQRIVVEMKFTGSRFLTRQKTTPPGLWYRVDDMEAENLIFRLLAEEESRLLASFSQDHDPSAPPRSGGSFSSSAYSEQAMLEEPQMAVDYKHSQLDSRGGVSPDMRKAAFSNSHDRTTLNHRPQGAPNVKNGRRSPSANLIDLTEDVEDPKEGTGLATDSENGLPAPGQYDVICGRGRGNFRHPGNRRMLRMFWNVKDKYNRGTKLQKTMIGRAIVDDIKGKGGRFLKRVQHGWEEVEKKTVLRKICHGIRDIPNDPEKRKRSIVADELEDPEDPSGPNPHSAPWLASQASMKNPPTAKKNESEKKPEEARKKAPSNSVKQREPMAPMAPMATKLIENGGTGLESLVAKKATTVFAAENATKVPPAPVQRIQENVALAPLDAVVITTPTVDDVLLGRGKGFFQHPGNRRMLQLISQCTERYKAASKSGRSQLVRSVYKSILSNGARFLKRVDHKGSSGWRIVTHTEALSKVSHGIRDYMQNSEGYAPRKDRVNKNSAKSPPPSPSSASPSPSRTPTGPAPSRTIRQPDIVRSAVQQHGFLGDQHYFPSSRGGLPAGFSAYEYALAEQAAHARAPHPQGLAHDGMPLHVLMAVRRQAEVAAVAAATGGGRRFTPEEQHMLMLQGSGRGLTPTELMLMREREMQRHRFM